MKSVVVLLLLHAVAFKGVKGHNWFQEYEEAVKHLSEEDLRREYPEKIRPQTFKHPPFKCPDMSPSPTVPTSVEFVKAADIKVIAALGDSLTTAIGANGSTLLGIPIEYRHVSWSIGGHGTYQDVITLANIVKLFNPDVLFPAPKWTLNDHPVTVNDTGFNLAVTGHNTLNISEQTRHMIDTFKTFPGLDFEEDWKLVTVLIGMNDICDYCKNKTLFSADNFISYLTESLEMMMNEVPRLIVNVVQILQMRTLREVSMPTLACVLQKYVPLHTRQFRNCARSLARSFIHTPPRAESSAPPVLPDELHRTGGTCLELNLEFQVGAGQHEPAARPVAAGPR
ncbi:phospholipase B1, membrane-associated-like [Denticeps clupeoides]|uniref:phospholipase B1, membrane-associated-like n=1 Tax=Denticeps clupeoides TaxID=299321 RepID=UPI0010A57FFC|nr:phospholipase B1, membrane-associated-like [Denticeps clupeoides]